MTELNMVPAGELVSDASKGCMSNLRKIAGLSEKLRSGGEEPRDEVFNRLIEESKKLTEESLLWRKDFWNGIADNTSNEGKIRLLYKTVFEEILLISNHGEKATVQAATAVSFANSTHTKGYWNQGQWEQLRDLVIESATPETKEAYQKSLLKGFLPKDFSHIAWMGSMEGLLANHGPEYVDRWKEFVFVMTL